MKNLNNKDILFVIPQNDGESVEIKKLLQENNQQFLITSQSWGASWEKLESSIKEALDAFTGQVYGVELQGNGFFRPQSLNIAPHVINIDHHKYENDDRTNELSSLEQVAKLLNVKLTDYQKAVSWNDKGFIPLMEQNNVPLETISLVRKQDRLAQGITEEQEKQAQEACNSKTVRGNLTIVRCRHSKTACITDRLYGQYKDLLIISDDGEVNFFGNGEVCLKLQEKFGGWSGGQLPESGYWGGYPTEEQVNEIINLLKIHERENMLLSCAKSEISMYTYFKWIFDNGFAKFTGGKTQRALNYGGYPNSRAGEVEKWDSCLPVSEFVEYKVPISGVDYSKEYICDGYISAEYSADGNFMSSLDYREIPYSPFEYGLDDYHHYGYIQDQVVNKCKQLGIKRKYKL